MEWQPIDTVPKDGTWVLIAIPPGKYGNKEWIVTAAMWDTCNNWGWWTVKPKCWVSNCLTQYSDNAPTLWQPFSSHPTPLDIARAEVMRLERPTPPPKPQETP